MRAKIFFITLAVDDFGRAVAFYRDGLGWPTEGTVGQEFHDELTGADGTIAIFTLDDGLLLTLYERANLAKDASLPAGPPSSTEFSLGIPARSQAEVDRLLAQVEAAGGTLTAPAHMRPFGVYSRVFHRSRRSPVRDRLELQRVAVSPAGRLFARFRGPQCGAMTGAAGPHSAWPAVAG
jgi:uncharacterized protein